MFWLAQFDSSRSSDEAARSTSRPLGWLCHVHTTSELWMSWKIMTVVSLDHRLINSARWLASSLCHGHVKIKWYIMHKLTKPENGPNYQKYFRTQSGLNDSTNSGWTRKGSLPGPTLRQGQVTLVEALAPCWGFPCLHTVDDFVSTVLCPFVLLRAEWCSMSTS